ncbi:hypothetical protein KA977_05805 [Candidatus Dependentiae bacterium]|nr:hypothetical protein [Candidatus Dependentiae bacterium]
MSNRIERINYAESIRVTNVCLIVENIWYDHNISAIFRTAECSGLKNIIVAGIISKKKIRHNHIDFKCSEYLNIKYTDTIEEAIDNVKKDGYKVYATYMTEDAKPIWESEFKGKTAIVMGTERTGISKSALSLCDEKIWIPTTGLSRSLNVSVSTGIIVYEILRQKRYVYNEITSEMTAPFMKFPGERS